MKNKVQEGDILVLAAPYIRVSGEAAIIGTIFGVAMQDLANGASGSFATRGVFDLAKAAVAITLGEAIYWDAAAKLVTNVSAGNTLVGKATQVQAIGDATCRVRLN